MKCFGILPELRYNGYKDCSHAVAHMSGDCKVGYFWGCAVTTAKITLQVDADLARVYQSAPAADQSKLSLLLNLWLRELLTRSTPLTTLMDELSDKAQARGLTAEKLEEMLRAR